MPKAEWGTKRLCASCGARFYDLGRTEVICPACDSPFDLENAGRTRRSRGGAKAIVETEAEKVEDVSKKTAAPDDDEEEEEEAEEVEETVAELDAEEPTGKGAADDDGEVTQSDDEEGEEDQSLIEDASELGDDDDVSDVIDGDIEESEQRE